MKKPLRLALIALLPLFTQAQQAPQLLWSHAFGNEYYDGVAALTTDADHNLYMGGYIGLTVDMDPGEGSLPLYGASKAALIGKYTQEGALVWAKVFTSDNTSELSGMGRDAAGNIYSTGSFRGTCDFDPGEGTFNISTANNPYSANDIFISKLSPEGNFVWAKAIKSIPTILKAAYSLAVDEAGNVYISGTFQETIDFDPGTGVFNLTALGSSDGFIAKYDTNGNFVWAKQFGATGKPVTAYKIIVDGTNIYTGGVFSGTVDFNPGEGTHNLTSHGTIFQNDIFIGKYSAANGDFVWAKNIGSAGDSRLYDLTADAHGNIISTGYSNQDTDFDPNDGVHNFGTGSTAFLLKLDANGNFVWVTGPVVNHLSTGLTVATDSSGNIYTGGYFLESMSFFLAGVPSLNSYGDRDLYLAKFSPDAEPLWQKQIGSADYEEMIQLAPEDDGSVYAGGNFRATLNFAPDTATASHTAVGLNDLFIARYGFPDVSSTDTFANDALRIYPNPSNGTVHIAAPDGLLGTQAALYNMTGQRIQTFALPESFSTTHLAAGIYLLQVTDGKANYNAKIIVK